MRHSLDESMGLALGDDDMGVVEKPVDCQGTPEPERGRPIVLNAGGRET
jgi:hypothetical protein